MQELMTVMTEGANQSRRSLLFVAGDFNVALRVPMHARRDEKAAERNVVGEQIY